MKNTYTGWSQMDTYSSSVRVSFPGFGPQTKYSYSILGGFYFPVTSSFSSSSSSRQVNTTTRLTQWHTIWYAGWEDNTGSSLFLIYLFETNEAYLNPTVTMSPFGLQSLEYYYRNQIVILD